MSKITFPVEASHILMFARSVGDDNPVYSDAEAAKKPYEGVPGPLTAEDVADCVAWTVTRPPHVNIDRIVVRPLAQAAQHKVHRVQ